MFAKFDLLPVFLVLSWVPRGATRNIGDILVDSDPQTGDLWMFYPDFDICVLTDKAPWAAHNGEKP